MLCLCNCNIKCIPEERFLEVSEDSIYNQVVSGLYIPLPSPLFLLYTSDEDLEAVPDALWANISTDIEKVIGAESIEIQIHPSKLLPKLSQYLLNPGAKEASNL